MSSADASYILSKGILRNHIDEIDQKNVARRGKAIEIEWTMNELERM